MSVWPPVWETSLAPGSGGRAAHYLCVVSEIEDAPALAALGDEERRSLANTLLRLDAWASAAEVDLRDCPWPREELRSPERSPVAPVAELDREGKARRRFKLLVDLIDACWTARECIFAGKWAFAVEWALLAGNGSLLDQAEIGRKSRATLSKRGEKKPYPAHLTARDASILREAQEIRASNPRHSLKAIAREIVERHQGKPGAPSMDTVRKVLRGLKKTGTQGLRSQV